MAFKLLVPVGVVLFVSIFIWSQYSTRYQERRLIDKAVSDVDKFCNSVLKLTWFAMLHSPSEDMQDIMESMAEYNDIHQIRLYSCQGQVRFSNLPDEIGVFGAKTDVACRVCHASTPPVIQPDIKERTRIFTAENGELRLGVINPILNDPSCSTAACHYHPAHITKLGSLDVVVSLEGVRAEISRTRRLYLWTAVYLFATLAVTIGVIILFQVTRRINRVIKDTRFIADGKFDRLGTRRHSDDEIGQLSVAVDAMGREIKEKQTQLNLEKTRYQYLFEQVPCTITVHNKDYRLTEFNQEFERKFSPKYGDYCYAAYKGRDTKCANCPVEKTFEDGRSHFSEESGVNRDGTEAHWFVKTAPLLDEEGRVVAAMEMSLDISHRKKLEEKVRISERKYQAIFKNIPNPIFILDRPTLEILDCNDAALAAYKYEREELQGQHFSMLFPSRNVFDSLAVKISQPFHERGVTVKKDDDYLYVNIWIRPADFVDRNVMIVTVVDITQSVETEHQLIQAGKMATLGEMATGVAHELNQPLSVIKTASSFIARKIITDDQIDREVLKTLSDEIESHVDRASKITNHMRLFGRKSEFKKQKVNINDVLRRAFDIFSQQLKLREIEVIWDLAENLPSIMADPVRLEQVFINLLINARDAIVAKFEALEAEENRGGAGTTPVNRLRQITLNTRVEKDRIFLKIKDTGTGIKRSEMDKVFEPFFTTKKVGQGTGLGLSISYGIIRESGGEINVINNRSGGATFVVSFAVKEDHDKC